MLDVARQQPAARRRRHGLRAALWRPKLTRTPRGLRRVRTGYAYQPPALGTYRTHRAARPQGPTYCTYGVRVPASGVGYVQGTVATQATVKDYTAPEKGNQFACFEDGSNCDASKN